MSGSSRDLVELVRSMPGRRVLVLADLLVDEFVITGEPRVSREAPVLILKYRERRFVPGGGANAAANVAALGGIPVVLGEVGDDDSGRRLVDDLARAGADMSGVLVRSGARTPRKTRFLAGDKHVALQQVVRIDRIEPFERDPASESAIRARIPALVDGVDAVLASDYGLGFVEPALVRMAASRRPERQRRPPIAVDSRYRLFEHGGVDGATPSQPELESALGRSLDTPEALEEAGRDALARLDCQAIVLTRGSQGMMVFERGRPTVDVPPFGTGSVADVTGAGDTVMAALTLALAAGADWLAAARVANAAAGIAVTKMGTATVSMDELATALERGG